MMGWWRREKRETLGDEKPPGSGGFKVRETGTKETANRARGKQSPEVSRGKKPRGSP